MAQTNKFMPLSQYREYTPVEMKQRSLDFYLDMGRRRTVRDFSERPVPREVIENCLLAAGTAPSGANIQPWHFAVIGDPAVKRKIRERAEAEERVFYNKRASEEWLEALAPLDTTPEKPFLELAPYLIVVFAQNYGLSPEGGKIKHYYVSESVGIATGILITAIHQAGLVSLTYTPSPMDFLNHILKRSANERPYLIVVVGYPAEGTKIPVLRKKSLPELATFIE